MHKTPHVFTLEEGLDVRKLHTTGSVLHINEHLDELDNLESSTTDLKNVDFIGQRIENFATLAENMTTIQSDRYVKKKILDVGGGLPLKDPCTVFIAFSGYFENAEEPFDVQSLRKPLEVNLTMTDNEDHGLISGLDIAIKSMLVGELSLFLFSHEVAYGVLGVPPRIQPKAQCAFYVKLVKNMLTRERKINFSEPNMFGLVEKEVKKFYGAGCLLYRSNNFTQAANTFRKAIWMLHKCRLADEAEEKRQEKWLKKLYLNSALCYNRANQPLKTCTACNELNRLKSLWNNGRALFQNAKALRMIGQYDAAEKRLKRAIVLSPNSYYEQLKAEMDLLIQTKQYCNQTKLIGMKIAEKDIPNDNFKKEVDNLLKNFKESPDLCQLTLPSGLGSSELKYLREACIRENLYVRPLKVPLEPGEESETESISIQEPTLAIGKEDNQSSSDEKSDVSKWTHDSEVNHEQLMNDEIQKPMF